MFGKITIFAAVKSTFVKRFIHVFIEDPGILFVSVDQEQTI